MRKRKTEMQFAPVEQKQGQIQRRIVDQFGPFYAIHFFQKDIQVSFRTNKKFHFFFCARI